MLISKIGLKGILVVVIVDFVNHRLSIVETRTNRFYNKPIYRLIEVLFMSINYFSGIALAVFLLPSVSLAEVFKYECVYPKVFSEKSGYQASKFSLKFQHDEDSSKGFVVGNSGLTSVQVYAGRKGITFLEALPGGVIQTTTVALSGHSVHSRHTIINNLVPSQYYGSCTFKIDK